MKERPILFSASMVRGLLAGTKTQTRRAVWPQPASDQQLRTVIGSSGFVYVMDNAPLLPYPKVRRVRWDCPYGQPGDRLWVRESWSSSDYRLQRGPYLKPDEFNVAEARELGHLIYAADGTPDFEGEQELIRWVPSIHMPRWASRITLEITSVRVERLQEISEADVQAEGWTRRPEVSTEPQVHKEAARDWFMDRWESINGPGSWDANPWVWAIEFRRLA